MTICTNHSDCGITHNTAASWISVLEASYLIYLLRPYHKNFNKRLIESKGLEIDLILEDGEKIHAMEIKSGQTIAPDFFSSLKLWRKLAGQTDVQVWLIYGGETTLTNHNITVVPWKDISEFLPIDKTIPH